MDLLNLVVQPTWREFLMDLIDKEGMDPWSIDLMEVTDAYLKKVRELQSLDLRIPANVILASALLLRMKSDALSFDEPVQEEFIEERMLIDEELPQLVLKPDRARSRRVTLDELIQAVESVMREGRRVRTIHMDPVSTINIELPQKSMSELMSDTLSKAHELKDQEGVLAYSNLHSSLGYSQIACLLPVLHLMQDQKIVIWQDELFKEIFIKLVPEQQN